MASPSILLASTRYEEVAQTVPTWQLRGISSHASYHGAINREIAECRLSKHNRNCYLTRYSQARDKYTLSVRRRKEDDWVFQNFDIIITNEEGHITYEISGTWEKFSNIVELLEFYKRIPLNHNIDGIGEELVKERHSLNQVAETNTGDLAAESTGPYGGFPCLLKKDVEGKVIFVSKETGKAFSEGSEFMEYCEKKTDGDKESVFKDEEVAHSKICYQRFLSKEGLNKGIPSDVMKAMNDHPSFHGSITRVDATTLLFRKGKNCYLTRYSDYHKTCVISALRTSEDGELLQHFKLDITICDETIKYEVTGTQKEFEDIFALLEFYQKTPINHKIYTFGECLVSKFRMLHLHNEKRLSSIDLIKVQSQSLSEVAEESDELMPQDKTEDLLAEPEITKEEINLKSLKNEHVAKAVPEWKIKEIGNLPSFQGAMNVDEAEALLKEENVECCYLTRYSESREEHTLSVLRRREDEDIFQNFDIVIEQDRDSTSYEISGSEKKFSTIVELLDFYKDNPLNHSIDGIGDEIKSTTASKRHTVDASQQTESFGIEVKSPSHEQDSADATKKSNSEQRKSCVENTQMGTFNPQTFRKLLSKEGQDSAVPQWTLKAMKAHPSFHGSISRIEAAKKLIESGRSCYLTRYSEYNKFCVISVLRMSANGELLQHLELKIPQDGHRHTFKVAGTEKEFDDVSKLLEYYQKHALNQTDCLGEILQSKLTNHAIAVSTEDTTEIANEEEEKEELSHPTMSNLRCITYTDHEGQVHDFSLLELISERWWKAGMLLSVNLDKYHDPIGNNNKSCKRVFSKWVRSNGHEDYPLTWMGLHKLLVDMGRRPAAEKLYKVLKYRETSEIKYVDTMYTLFQ